jgi:hypothetical protein
MKKQFIPPIGSEVIISLGPTKIKTRVIEHRGPIGVGGRYIIRVRWFWDSVDEPQESEVPAEEVELVDSVKLYSYVFHKHKANLVSFQVVNKQIFDRPPRMYKYGAVYLPCKLGAHIGIRKV